MQKISITTAIFVSVLFASCSSNEAKKEVLPSTPVSVEAVKSTLKAVKYKAEKAGIRFLSTDKEIKWLEPKADEKMEKEVVEKVKSTQFHFVNDTSCQVVIAGKNYSGTYSVDDEVVNENEKPGIKIRVSYVDEEFKFGDGTASMVTYTYIVEGISEKNILLETPRSLNRKNIVILMSKEAKE